MFRETRTINSPFRKWQKETFQTDASTAVAFFLLLVSWRDKLGVGLPSGETPCNIPGKCFLMGSLGSQKGVCRYQNRTSRKINLATVVENYPKKSHFWKFMNFDLFLDFYSFSSNFVFQCFWLFFGIWFWFLVCYCFFFILIHFWFWDFFFRFWTIFRFLFIFQILIYSYIKSILIHLIHFFFIIFTHNI